MPATRQPPAALRTARGLTLIELLVCVALVGAALAGLLKLLSPSGAAATMQPPGQRALAIAETLLDALPAVPDMACEADAGSPPPDCTEDVDALEQDLGLQAHDPAAAALGYRATLTVNPRNEAQAGADRMRLVTVTVSAPGGMRVSLSAFRPVQPAPPSGAAAVVTPRRGA